MNYLGIHYFSMSFNMPYLNNVFNYMVFYISHPPDLEFSGWIMKLLKW